MVTWARFGGKTPGVVCAHSGSDGFITIATNIARVRTESRTFLKRSFCRLGLQLWAPTYLVRESWSPFLLIQDLASSIKQMRFKSIDRLLCGCFYWVAAKELFDF